MNLSQNISLLKQINTKLDNVDNALTNDITSYPFQNGLTLSNINSTLTDIDTTLETISNNVSEIKTDVYFDYYPRT